MSSEVEKRPDGKLVDLPETTTAEERSYNAHQLRLAGHSWKEVAEAVGFANAATATMAVRSYLQRARMELDRENRIEALTLELERLDTLQNAYWQQAMAGDVKAAEYVLKVLMTRAKLLGLDELASESVGQTSKTIIVAGNETDYVAAVRAIAEAS